MSSSQASEVAEYASIVLNNHCGNVVTVLVIFDAVITMADEIRCFWGRKLTGAAVLFWLNKYLIIAFLVPTQLSVFLSISEERYGGSTKPNVSGGVALNDFLQLCICHKDGICLPSDGTFGMGRCLTEDPTPARLIKLSLVHNRGRLPSDRSNLDRIIAILLSPLQAGDLEVFIVRRTATGCILAILNTLHLTFTMLSVSISLVLYKRGGGSSNNQLLRYFYNTSANLRAASLGSSQSLQIPGGSVIFERVIGLVGAQISREDYFGNEDMDFEHGSGEIGGYGESVGE
ncbi:hypothetical protein V8D89_005022 [Ganoderma adspersum]